MNNLQTNSQTLPDRNVETSPAIRELSTEQRKDWIERIFTRLAGIYGSEFSYKWADVDNEQLKAEWADALGGFHAEDIASALQSCRSQPKAPNLPEFASLCRQNMNTRHTVVDKPLTAEERQAAAKVAEAVAKGMREKAEESGIKVNGVSITKYRKWAVNLMQREASGEQLPSISMETWRLVFGFPTDIDAKTANASL